VRQLLSLLQGIEAPIGGDFVEINRGMTRRAYRE
jgi:hypothetical protein